MNLRLGSLACKLLKLSFCAALLVAAGGAQPASDWTIDTVAGTGLSEESGGGLGGDGGPAVEARLRYPFDVAVDETGSLYIVDTWNHRIRKVDSAGIVTTVAGSGTTGGKRRRVQRGRRTGGRGAATLPRRRGVGRVRQPLHCRYLESPYSQGRFCGDRDHNCGKRDDRGRRRRVRRGWRTRGRGAAKIPLWRGVGRVRQPLHCRCPESPHSQGRLCGDRDHNCGKRDGRVRRGRRTGSSGAAKPSSRRGVGRVRQPLHCRCLESPHSQG